MKKIVRAFTGRMSDSLGLVQGNARVILFTSPFWTVTNNLFAPYMTLYMLAVGCTNEQVGMINAIGMLAGAFVALFAGWLTDRMGRRLANAVGDLICWGISCLIWAFSRNVVWFMAAACTSAFGNLSGVAWACMLSEGTQPEHRVNVFWWQYILVTAATFLTPLMNLLILPFGLAHSMRWVLVASSGVLVFATCLRYRLLRELPVGLERRQAARRESPLAALKAYAPMFRLVRSSPLLLIYILLRTLYNVQYGIKATYLPVAIVGGLGFTNGIIGTLNLLTGAVMLLAQVLLLPALRRLSADKAMAFSIATLAASMLMLVLAPAHCLALLALSTVLTAGGSVVTAMLVDTSMANALPDNERAPFMSMTSVLMVALTAPFMWLGGLLAGLPGVGPRLPMALIAGLFAVCLALLAAAGRLKKMAARLPAVPE